MSNYYGVETGMSKGWWAVIAVGLAFSCVLLIRACRARPDSEPVAAVEPSPVPVTTAPAPALDYRAAVKRAYWCGYERATCDLSKKGCGLVLVADCAGVDVGNGPQ